VLPRQDVPLQQSSAEQDEVQAYLAERGHVQGHSQERLLELHWRPSWAGQAALADQAGPAYLDGLAMGRSLLD